MPRFLTSVDPQTRQRSIDRDSEEIICCDRSKANDIDSNSHVKVQTLQQGQQSCNRDDGRRLHKVSPVCVSY